MKDDSRLREQPSIPTAEDDFTDDDWGLLIKSLGPVLAITLGKLTKKSKKKYKTISID